MFVSRSSLNLAVAEDGHTPERSEPSDFLGHYVRSVVPNDYNLGA